MNIRHQIASLYICLTWISSVANAQPISLSYGLRPGMELLFETQMDLLIEGPYSEESTRTIESRFVVLNEAQSGAWPILGVSRLKNRILEGQEIPITIENREAYQFSITSKGELRGETTERAELGTGWTPMIHFPPLPDTALPPDVRTESNLPIYVGLGESSDGRYTLIARNTGENDESVLIGAGLMNTLQLQDAPPVILTYQEHEIHFEKRSRLPSISRTSSQMKMDSPEGAFHINLTVDSQLKQANRFPLDRLPDIRQYVSTFLNYKEQLTIAGPVEEEKILQSVISFSERAPIQFLRETAKDLVLKHRYNMRFDANRRNADLAEEAPAFSGVTMQEKLVRFPLEKKKPTVLLFWALWWEPAEKALWEMEELYKTMADKKNIDCIGINLDSAKTIGQRYIENSKITLPVLWDEGYPQSGIAFDYGVHRVPTVVVINKRGKIIARDIQGEELKTFLNKL